eukprot:1194651-Prorocentrum_minimum.AAC.9
MLRLHARVTAGVHRHAPAVCVRTATRQECGRSTWCSGIGNVSLLNLSALLCGHFPGVHALVGMNPNTLAWRCFAAAHPSVGICAYPVCASYQRAEARGGVLLFARAVDHPSHHHCGEQPRFHMHKRFHMHERPTKSQCIHMDGRHAVLCRIPSKRCKGRESSLSPTAAPLDAVRSCARFDRVLGVWFGGGGGVRQLGVHEVLQARVKKRVCVGSRGQTLVTV